MRQIASFEEWPGKVAGDCMDDCSPGVASWEIQDATDSDRRVGEMRLLRADAS